MFTKLFFSFVFLLLVSFISNVSFILNFVLGFLLLFFCAIILECEATGLLALMVERGGEIRGESSFSHRQIRNVTSRESHLLELVTVRLLIKRSVQCRAEPIKPNFLMLSTYSHTPIFIIIVAYFVFTHNVLLRDRFCVVFNLFFRINLQVSHRRHVRNSSITCAVSYKICGCIYGLPPHEISYISRLGG